MAWKTLPSTQMMGTDQDSCLPHSCSEVALAVNGVTDGRVTLTVTLPLGLTVALVTGNDPFVVLTGNCWKPPYGRQVCSVTFKISGHREDSVSTKSR